jgi:hypothetical protein
MRTQQGNGDSLLSCNDHWWLASSTNALGTRADAWPLMPSLNIHLVVEDLGLARLGLWDERLIQNIKDILADFFEFGLNLLTIVTDGADVLVGAL